MDDTISLAAPQASRVPLVLPAPAIRPLPRDWRAIVAAELAEQPRRSYWWRSLLWCLGRHASRNDRTYGVWLARYLAWRRRAGVDR